MNRDVLKKIVVEQMQINKIQKLVEGKWDAWKKKHGEEGTEYIDAKGVKHKDPWDDEKIEDPEPEEDKEELEEELEIEE